MLKPSVMLLMTMDYPSQRLGYKILHNCVGYQSLIVVLRGGIVMLYRRWGLKVCMLLMLLSLLIAADILHMLNGM